ncbi:MAG TPA: histone deacetylase [Dehalococcoidales bacterium]|nr:histone deacetylase [Dehalococcoidales bacterium]
MAITILYREDLKEYDFGVGHSFRGDRFEVFPQFLKQNLAENGNYRVVEADPATDEDLQLICQQEYLDFTQGYYQAANLGLTYPGEFSRFQSQDNKPKSQPGKTEEAARLVVGQAKTACDLIQDGTTKKAVSIGGGFHHAKPNYGEGFCIYNDVAFSARYLQNKYKLDRILILDTDAHAGNGTAEYFYEDPTVLLIDIHQDPRTVYPGTGFADQTGSGDGKGFTVNIPLPVYSGQESYERVFEEIVQPVAEEFKPQIIIRNGGSDPHVSDGLTCLGLQVRGFRMIGERVRELARLCDDKEIDLICSGYNKEVLPYAWLAMVCGVSGIDSPLQQPESIDKLEKIPSWLGVDRFSIDIQAVINDVKNYLKDYWQCFR